MKDGRHDLLAGSAAIESGRLSPAASLYKTTPQPRILREEVLELIEPWRESSEQPPFSMGELVVIALVLLNEHSATLQRIQHKIYRTFGYYNDQALLEYMTGSPARRDVPATASGRSALILPNGTDGGRFKASLYKATKHFDLPVRRSGAGQQKSLGVVKNAARVHLRHWLEPARKGTFDFMSLPSELREKIYKMLMVCPKSGLSYTDDLEATVSSSGYYGLSVEKHSATFAILSVCKATHHEALPVFYNNNVMEFKSLDGLISAFERMSTEIIKEIRILHIFARTYDISPHGALDSDRALELLRALSPNKLILSGSPNFFTELMLELTDLNVKSGGSMAIQEIIGLMKRARTIQVRANSQVQEWLDWKLDELEKA